MNGLFYFILFYTNMLIYRKYYNNDGMAVEPDDRDGRGGTRARDALVLSPQRYVFFGVFFKLC
jgi:hypothetical protein